MSNMESVVTIIPVAAINLQTRGKGLLGFFCMSFLSSGPVIILDPGTLTFLSLPFPSRAPPPPHLQSGKHPTPLHLWVWLNPGVLVNASSIMGSNYYVPRTVPPPQQSQRHERYRQGIYALNHKENKRENG